MPAAEDLGFHHGEAGPTTREFAVDAFVQEAVFGHGREAALPTEALVPVVPEMPLALDEEVEGTGEPLQGGFAAANLGVVRSLETRPFDAPSSDKEIVPANAGLSSKCRLC